MFDVLMSPAGPSDFAWSQPLAAWLLTYALHSGLLLGTAWLLARRFTGALAQDVLWKTVVVAGLVTATIQVGLQPTASETAPALERPAVVLESEAAGQLAEVRADETMRPEIAEASPRSTELVVPSGRRAETAPAEGGASSIGLLRGWPLPASPWVLVLIGLWLLGVAVEGLRRARTHRRFMARIADRTPVGAPVLVAELDALARQAGIRHPLRLTQSTTLAVPVALGVHEVVLPTWAVDATPPAQQRALLAHEVAHLARRDPFWLAVFAVIESVFFFQPLNHLARRRQQGAAERLCDAWAAEQASPLAMARCLVEAAGRLRAPVPVLPHLVSGMAAGGRSSLEDRVGHLMDRDEAAPYGRWPVVVAACCAIGLVACAGPVVTSTTQSSSSVVATSQVTQHQGDVPVPPAAPSTSVLSGLNTSAVATYTRTEEGRSLRLEREGVVVYEEGVPVVLSKGGRLLIEEALPRETRRYEARPVANERRYVDYQSVEAVYQVDGVTRPLDDAGRRWLVERVREMQELMPPSTARPQGQLGAEQYDRQWDEYGRQLDRYATQMKAFAAQAAPAPREDHQRHLVDYAIRMERFTAEMAFVHGRDLEARVSALGSMLGAWSRAYRARSAARLAAAARLADEIEQAQDPTRRAELERQRDDLLTLRIPLLGDPSEELGRQALALQREAHRLHDEAGRLAPEDRGEGP
ncbi:MAG: M56 family metallopeptidase [Bacteroidota bacterium]